MILRAQPAIELQGLSVHYKLHNQRAGSFKAAVIGRLKRTGHPDFLPALRAVNLIVNPGESVAVLGPNGSGKTTLLKAIAGIFSPSGGRVRVAGRIAPLLEIGAGFSMDLTGHENIFLYAALLGMTRAEVHAKLDRIIAFSELDRFIYSPLRHYSAGMYMRLAFAIAIHAEADVLLIDEVIAVGDGGFQAKCREAIQKRRKDGATVLIVSHAPLALQGLCERGLVLNRGRIDCDGSLETAAKRYQEMF